MASQDDEGTGRPSAGRTLAVLVAAVFVAAAIAATLLAPDGERRIGISAVDEASGIESGPAEGTSIEEETGGDAQAPDPEPAAPPPPPPPATAPDQGDDEPQLGGEEPDGGGAPVPPATGGDEGDDAGGGAGQGGGDALARAKRLPVAVLSGSGVPGIAGRTGMRLEQRGFRVGTVANAPGPLPRTTVLFRGSLTDEARALARASGFGPVRRVDGPTGAIAPRAQLLLVVGGDAR